MDKGNLLDVINITYKHLATLSIIFHTQFSFDNLNMEVLIFSFARIRQCANRTFSCATINKVLKFNIANSNTMISEIFKNNGNLQDEQWIEIRTDLLKNFNLTEMNLDSKIFNICFYYKKYDEAKRYFKFLESNNYEMKLDIIGNYIKSFSLQGRPITKEEEIEIFRVYDNLREKYTYLDKITCSHCIDTLSLTKRWKESLSLIKMIEMVNKPGVNNMVAIISAALTNDDIKLAWNIMNTVILTLPLPFDIYKKYLNYCKRNFHGIELIKEIEKIFIFWRDNKINPSQDIINTYADFFNSIGHSANITTILKTGYCSNCQLLLKQTTITKDEFQILSTSILKNVIIGQNLFYATSPQELKKYMVFINSMQPYDVVIDGLNVAYSFRNNSGAGSLKPIIDIVNYFYYKEKRILVIGRIHMLWWSKEIMKDIKKKADIFMTKNLSEDDPFLLHITLRSGPDTYFVSRDLMRSHKFKLVDANLKKLFLDWQISRQYLFKVNKIHGNIDLIPPPTFDLKTQSYDKGWHMPYKCNNQLMQPDNYDIPETWLCLKYET